MVRNPRPHSPSLAALLRRSTAPHHLHQLHAQLILNNFTFPLLTISKHTNHTTKLLHHALHHRRSPPPLALCNQIIRNSPLPNAFNIFSLLASPNSFTFASLLLCCAKARALRPAQQLHARALARNLHSQPHVATNLINVYSACSCFDDARKVFDEMPDRSIVSYNSMLAACVNAGQLGYALELFRKMKMKDVVSWSTVIGGCVRAGNYSSALQLFKAMMKIRGAKLDAVVMLHVVSACAALGDLLLGASVHAVVCRLPLPWGGAKDSAALCNSIVDMYFKCGGVEEAVRVFTEMEKRSTVSWNVMISGLAANGRGREALVLFKRMSERPDSLTFLALLSACCSVGGVEEGRVFFRRMFEEFGIEPGLEHYGCMVDLLSRAGCLREARELIGAMPVRPNEAVWGALLDGCRKHGDVELAREAISRIRELKPEKERGYFMLLSDLYASANKWGDFGTVKETMVDTSDDKTVSRSSVHVGFAG